MSRAVIAPQALVAIGGRATRLRAEDIRVGASKSFMVSGRRPLLYWCLKSLHAAGVRRLVLAGNEPVHLRKAEAVLRCAHFEFDSVVYVQDAGLGLHGLPAQLTGLLEDTVLFEAGHGISHPRHYQAMLARKTEDNVVFSAFPTNPGNPRYRVLVDGEGRGYPAFGPSKRSGLGLPLALAQPMLIDRRYVELLSAFDYTVDRIADHYLATGRLAAVRSGLPVEFDLSGEYRVAMGWYRLSLAADPAAERPWSSTELSPAGPR
jgi:hypothetical protein